MEEEKEKTERNRGLCFRCDHRAAYLETGRGPRYECQQPESTVYGCYMYRPVRPAVTSSANPDDPRPRFGPALVSSRERFVEVVSEEEVHLELVLRKDKSAFLHWAPKPTKPSRAEKRKTIERLRNDYEKTDAGKEKASAKKLPRKNKKDS